MNNLMIFEGQNVEVFEFQGRVLFNPKDVAKCLELSDSAVRNYLAVMNEKQAIILTNSKVLNTDIRKLANRGEKFLTERGVYKLIFKSKKESAERFQDWVTDEVLPSIRQSGGYLGNVEEMTDEEIMAKALLVAQKTIDNKNKLIQEMKPKAEIYDRFVDKDATWGFRDLRKELESTLNITIKEKELKQIMRDKKWIGETTRGLAYAIRNGYVVTKDIFDKFDNPRTQDRFTVKAREELLEYYKENFITF